MRLPRLISRVAAAFLILSLWSAPTMAAGLYAYVSGPDGGIQQNGWYQYNEHLPSLTLKGGAGASCGTGTFTLSLAPGGSDNMGSHVLRYFYAPSDHNGDLWVSRDGNLLGSICNNDANFTGDTVTVWQGTIKYDAWPPVVNVDNPVNNIDINSASTTVSGTAYDTGDDHKTECMSLSKCSLLASVSVNGVAATISGDRFSARVPLKPGLNTILATATDHAGIASSSSPVTVLRSQATSVSSKSPNRLLELGIGAVAVAGLGTAVATGHIPFRRK